VPWWRSVQAAPIEEGDGGGLDQFVNAGLSAVIRVLVYRFSPEALDPGFEISGGHGGDDPIQGVPLPASERDWHITAKMVQ
jgi:hypothetical protein